MELKAYLDRIGFRGTPVANLETLIRMQRQHAFTIPYENIDIHLGRELTMDIEAAYTKLVEQRRGGWCYEMNGLLGWALEEVGFEVMRMIGGVRRAERGDSAMGNHLVLCAMLSEPWVVDVGLGDGPPEPYPLRAHSFSQLGFDFQLEKLEDCWRMINYPDSSAPSFDFTYLPADEALLSEKCDWLSTSEESPFMEALVCQLVVADGFDVQIGRVATRVTPLGKEKWQIDSADELAQSLKERFDLNIPELAGLWDKIEAQHEAYLATKA